MYQFELKASLISLPNSFLGPPPPPPPLAAFTVAGTEIDFVLLERVVLTTPYRRLYG
jgi:hypothetical protein